MGRDTRHHVRPRAGRVSRQRRWGDPARQLGARFVVVVGPDEIATGQVTLREMATGSEERVEIRDLEDIVVGRLGA